MTGPVPGKAGPCYTYQVSGPLVVLPTCGPVSMGLVLFLLLYRFLLVKIYYFYFTCVSVLPASKNMYHTRA